MMLSSLTVRFFGCLLVLAVSATFATAEEAADAIWQKTVAAYGALKSYSDTGTVQVELPGVSETHKFTSRYLGPRNYLFDFVKHDDADRYVIWSDAQAFHTWWRTTQLEEEYPPGTGVNAFGQADFLTVGSALKLSPLIFSGSGLQGPLLNFTDIQLDGEEDIGGRKCHRLLGMTRDVYTATGREVNIRQITVWIDAETFLVRKILEESPRGTPPAQAGTTTTTFEPVLNPKLEAAAFQFEAPAAN
jgi:outer membrane lipoprotein-sorting protein